MHFNNTTRHISPLKPKPKFPGYYVLILFVLLILTGCVVAVVRTVLFRLVLMMHISFYITALYS